MFGFLRFLLQRVFECFIGALCVCCKPGKVSRLRMFQPCNLKSIRSGLCAVRLSYLNPTWRSKNPTLLRVLPSNEKVITDYFVGINPKPQSRVGLISSGTFGSRAAELRLYGLGFTVSGFGVSGLGV